MNCKNCNTHRPENQTKCPNCGSENISETQVQTETEYISAAGEERKVPKGLSSKKNIIIVIAVAIVLIVGGVTAVAVTTNGFDFTGIRTTLQLADRYLSEQNYEQAIIEFEKVLEIEPMNVDAYLGLAEAYVALGETDKAVKILEKGIKQTNNDRLRDRLEEIRKSLKPVITEAEVTTAVKTEPAVTELSVEEGTVTILGEEYYISRTTSLNLFNKEITDEILRDIMPEIKMLANLRELDLGANQITDITSLAQLTNLTELYLSNSQITDITLLAELTNLTHLDLYDNQITDIVPLAQLTNLTWLNLSHNQITDIAPLAQLTNLTWLLLTYNQITEITSLAQLTNLTVLDLSINQITDMTPLTQLTNLTEMQLWSNLIPEQDIESLRSKLPNCNII